MDTLNFIPTTCISDSMNGLNNLDSAIKPLKEDHLLFGPAFTVKMPVGDNRVVLKAIKEANPGDVLVIDAKGDEYRAIAGDFIIGMAKTLGIAGIVTDGVIRDIRGTKELDYPVFCKGTTVAASGKSGWGEMNTPISCGGVSIHPGDWVAGDTDGVVVIPKNNKASIMKSALEKLTNDQEREKTVSGDIEAIRKYLEKF
ncbi:Regulator of RNase E activity RraA [Lentibacillus halodurans]|uniref:Putative 4-hydroxy-4-methyl-2-oxoglutarate aldolase n=1 Tax=Lentibacillus halodurans TaxID=237679 RepID=A0A1I0XK67_9BACI|nr:RraA family protein [Lentibacillus halodurans]SFB01402.1 Regulator of RNase E activity RraA [Lentibacillus halodurans]